MSLNEKLVYLMQKKQINTAELSRKTGLPYTTIDGLLKRNIVEKIKLQNLYPLKKFFGVSLDYLMDDNITDEYYGIIFDTGKSENYELMEKINHLSEDGKHFIQKMVDNLLEYEKSTINGIKIKTND
jgi:transcriptional regulator with XRE-family HTH domain